MQLGWDARYRPNFALEISLGVEMGKSGLFADDPRNNESIQGSGWLWADVGAWEEYTMPFIRLGVGIGRW